ncbi:MAG: cupredoxin domain-containing protein [Chloroflexota bacterium]
MLPRPLPLRDLRVLSGFIITALIVGFAPLPASHPEPTERTIRVQASRFAYQPGIIRVNPGDTVTLEFTSNDVVHGFAVDDYDVEMIADPGQVSRLTFTADRRGSFRFRCSVTCGDMHPFMIGKLQVGPNTLLWRAGALALAVSAVGLWRWRR